MRALLVMIVIVALAAIFVFALRTARPNNIAMLPNGVRIELLGATTGGRQFTTEKPWHKTARKILPRQFQSWIPRATSGACSGDTNHVTMHFQVTDPAWQNQSVPWHYYEVKDDEGRTFERTGGFCSSGRSSNSTIYSFPMRSVPRRQKEFTFDFLDSQNSVIASFRVLNSAKGPFPQWTPSPLPQTKSNGPVVLTLESIQLAGSKPSLYVKPTWNLAADDPLWTNARARYVTLFDATGNEGQMLSMREPAWLLRTLVHRERDQDFAPSERLTITNLAVPDPGEFFALDQIFKTSGVEVTLLVLSGSGDFILSNGVRSASSRTTGSYSTSSSGTSIRETWGDTKPFLLIEVRGGQDADELRVHPTDERTKIQDTGYNGGGGKRTYKLAITLDKNQKSVSFNVILSRPRIFEFTIDPKQGSLR